MSILSAAYGRLNALSVSAIIAAVSAFTILPSEAADVNKNVAAVFYGEVGVGNFDPTGYHAYQEMLKNHSFDKSEFAESVPFEKAVEVLTDFGRRGFGLVILHSEGYQSAARRVAAEFPDTKFVITPAGDGVDSLSIDHSDDMTFIGHALCAEYQIVNTENLTNLHLLVSKRFEYFGLPLHFREGTGSPIRAVAIL
jgi:hypothetical protein